MAEQTPLKNDHKPLYGGKTDFVPLLLGNDINTYSMARAFHELYGLRSTVWGKYASGPCCNSAIIDFYTCAENDHPDYFLPRIAAFSEEHRDKSILLIGCGDSYVRLCSEHLGSYPDNVIAPYPDSRLMETLFHKERFYRICRQHGVAYPNTLIHRREMGTQFDLPFAAPYVLKPANPVMYWQFPFPTQKKVFILEDRAALQNVLDDIYGAGYSDTMIIQDFIPGDDTHMRVLTGYSNKEGRVELMALGQVLLEEHTPMGIGNHAVIINEYNEALATELKRFLEAIGFVGFFNFDLKYDRRDGTYRMLELNVRQGRSNYYVTGAGHNLAQYAVNDRLLDRSGGCTIVREKYLWTVVPRSVMFSYIRPRQYRDEMKELIRAGRSNNPLDYAADKNIKRHLSLFRSQLGHIYKYRKYLGRKKLPSPAPAASGYL